MTPIHREGVEVTQADRDAAYALKRVPAILTGAYDGSMIVQAFARHRIASISPPTPDADGLLDSGASQATETWSPCPGFARHYIVSSLGRVRNIDTGKLLFGEVDRDGYRRVNLSIDGKKYKRRVHRLICEAFHGPPPADSEVCHNDGTRGNNRAANLRWGTKSDNVRDAIRHGTYHPVGKAGTKFSPEQAEVIRKRSSEGASGYTLAREFECSPRVIHRIVRGETYRD